MGLALGCCKRGDYIGIHLYCQNATPKELLIQDRNYFVYNLKPITFNKTNKMNLNLNF